MAIEVQLSDAPVAWHLTEPGELFAAAEDLAGRGYRGEVAFWHAIVDGAPTGALQWSLEVRRESGSGEPQKAHLGDYLLLSGGVLQRLSATEFAELTA